MACCCLHQAIAWTGVNQEIYYACYSWLANELRSLLLLLLTRWLQWHIVSCCFALLCCLIFISLLYKLRSVQATGARYKGRGRVVRTWHEADRPSARCSWQPGRGLCSVPQSPAQILICFIAYLINNNWFTCVYLSHFDPVSTFTALRKPRSGLPDTLRPKLAIRGTDGDLINGLTKNKIRWS